LKRAAILVLLLFSTSLASAQGNTFVSAGLGLPQKPAEFSSYWKAGLSLGGGIEAPITDWVALVGGFDLTNFPLNEERYLDAQGVAGTGVSISGGTASILTLLAGAKLNVLQNPKSVSAYLSGLFGYMNFSTRDFEVTGGGISGTLAGEERSSLCVSGGVGVEMPIGKTTYMFIEGRYVVDFAASRTAFVPVRAGVKIRL
jgi:hypothetical protein